MDKKEQRTWIEIGKMVKKFQAIPEMVGCGIVFDNDYQETYEDLKENYFKYVLKIEETELLPLDLSPECWDLLCQQADEQDITIDEVVANILKAFIEANPVQYRLLNLGEQILDTDEFFNPLTCEWQLRKYKTDAVMSKDHNPFRRLMK